MSAADEIAALAERGGQPFASRQHEHIGTALGDFEPPPLPAGRAYSAPDLPTWSATFLMQILASPLTVARLFGVPLSLADPPLACAASKMRSDYRRRQLARKRRGR